MTVTMKKPNWQRLILYIIIFLVGISTGGFFMPVHSLQSGQYTAATATISSPSPTRANYPTQTGITDIQKNTPLPLTPPGGCYYGSDCLGGSGIPCKRVLVCPNPSTFPHVTA